MLRVASNKLKPGMVLARPVRNPASPRVHYLNRGLRLDERSIRALTRLNVQSVWIAFSELEFLDDVINERALESQAEIYTNIRGAFENIGKITEAGLDSDVLADNVNTFFDALIDDKKNMTLLHHLEKYDNYLYSHCANVCSLAIMMAIKMGERIVSERGFTTFRKSATSLGIGAMLHDIGKLRVPKAILDKPGRLTQDELAEMRRHTEYGFDILRGQIEASAANISLHHHQRFDGAGYPTHLSQAGRDIHVFSRIVALADVYDAATSARVYSPAKPAVQVIYEMRKMNHEMNWFDPEMAEAFFEMMPPFPVGSIVTLSDNCTAAVVDYDSTNQMRPTVRLLFDDKGRRIMPSREVDLTQAPDLTIVKLDGRDVAEFDLDAQTRQFAQPPEMRKAG